MDSELREIIPLPSVSMLNMLLAWISYLVAFTLTRSITVVPGSLLNDGPKYKSNDGGHFMVVCHNSSILVFIVIVNLLVCLIYKFSVSIDVYV